MIFESTAILLRNIVHSLQTENETEWQDHLEFGNQCVYELYQMSRTTGRLNPSSRVLSTAFERAVRAIPHVKAMNRAIRQQDRQAAIESGRAAIAEMDGMVRRTAVHAAEAVPAQAAVETVPERSVGTARRRKAGSNGARAAK